MPGSSAMPTSRSPLVLLFALLTLLVSSLGVQAQRYTTTLPWIDGDTIIVSQSTNALGATIAIETLSTIAGTTTTGVVPTTTTALVPTTTALVPTTTSLVRTTSRTTTTTPVGVTTDPLDDPTTTTTSRSRTSSIAIVATPTVNPGGINPVPAGTIMDYSDYQSSINQAASTGDVNPALNGGSNTINGAVSRVAGAGKAGVVGVVAVVAAGIVGMMGL